MKIEDYNKYYIQGSDHYLIPKDVFKELFNEMINWKQQCKKQKEVIDKAIKFINSIDLYSHEYALDSIEINDLLDILKEVSK